MDVFIVVVEMKLQQFSPERPPPVAPKTIMHKGSLASALDSLNQKLIFVPGGGISVYIGIFSTRYFKMPILVLLRHQSEKLKTFFSLLRL